MSSVKLGFSLSRLFLICLLLMARSSAQTGYLKVVRDEFGKPVKLQAAVVEFRNPAGQSVTLVSAIHVGEKEYYSRLNQHFKTYDSVLYEMVLDIPKHVAHQNKMRQLIGRDKKEPRIDTRKAGKDTVSRLQVKLAEILDLDYQLTSIDYSAPNFRHADLTTEEFEEARLQKKQGPTEILENFLQGDDAKGPPEYRALSQLPILKILASGPTPKERAAIKIGLATYFAESRDISDEIEGEVLIKLRDQHAIEILKSRLAKNEKKIAIFYGAAHMPDLARRLRELDFSPLSKSWISAWKL